MRIIQKKILAAALAAQFCMATVYYILEHTDTNLSRQEENSIVFCSGLLTAGATWLTLSHHYYHDQFDSYFASIQQISLTEQSNMIGLIAMYSFQLLGLTIAEMMKVDAKPTGKLTAVYALMSAVPWLISYLAQPISRLSNINDNEKTFFYIIMATLNGSMLGQAINRVVTNRMSCQIGGPVGAITSALAATGACYYLYAPRSANYTPLPTSVDNTSLTTPLTVDVREVGRNNSAENSAL